MASRLEQATPIEAKHFTQNLLTYEYNDRPNECQSGTLVP
jgi:hypothetical protein